MSLRDKYNPERGRDENDPAFFSLYWRRAMNVITEQPDHTRIPVHLAHRWEAGDENPAVPAVKVFITQKAYLRVIGHAHSDMDNEVGGWLLGRWCWDDDTHEEFIVIDASLNTSNQQNSSTHLTFTRESQVRMHAIKEERYPDKMVVGWFHTHPRMSLFLSGFDVFLHENFFPHPWQVALVIEPHTRIGGFFIRGADGDLNNRKYYGFYELTNRKNQSVVHWRNLRPGVPEIIRSEEDA
jgi:proteasome lid subunit RPN8/RPN11